MTLLLRRLRNDERGAIEGLEMMLVLGLTIIPIVTAMAQVPRWIDARSTAELAAQEAVREIVLAPDMVTGELRANAIATQIALNHGWDASAISLSAPTGSFARGAEIEITATMEFPTIVVPIFGYAGGGSTVSATHVERIDDFRELVP